jgi:hypothetical protein
MAKNMAHLFYVIDVQFLFLMTFENLYVVHKFYRLLVVFNCQRKTGKQFIEVWNLDLQLWFMIVLLLLIEV